MQVIQHPDQLGRSLEKNPRFLQGLAYRRMHQRFIAFFRAPAGESNVTAPRIALVLSTLDEEHLGFTIGAAPQQNRDSGAPRYRILDFLWLA